jgi:hypothetical protein
MHTSNYTVVDITAVSNENLYVVLVKASGPKLVSTRWQHQSCKFQHIYPRVLWVFDDVEGTFAVEGIHALKHSRFGIKSFELYEAC